MELLGGTEENCVSPARRGQINVFFNKKGNRKIEIVARPKVLKGSTKRHTTLHDQVNITMELGEEAL